MSNTRIHIIVASLLLMAQCPARATSSAIPPFEDRPDVCISVEVDPSLQPRTDHQQYNRDTSGALGGRVTQRLRLNGINPHTPKGNNRVQPAQSLIGPNPPCGDAYLVKLRYEPLPTGEPFASELRIELGGMPIAERRVQTNVSELPKVFKRNAFEQYMVRDMDEVADIVFKSVNWK